MTLLLIPFNKDEQIVLWLLYTVSWFVIAVVIITKKIIVEYLIKKPLPGEKGVLGDRGIGGDAYFLKTYPDSDYAIDLKFKNCIDLMYYFSKLMCYKYKYK